jgi:hypothetical protein
MGEEPPPEKRQRNSFNLTSLHDEMVQLREEVAAMREEFSQLKYTIAIR